MDTDEALVSLGRYSRWQMGTYFLLCVGFSIPFAWMTMSVVYIGDSPAHRCAFPENATLNDSIPFETKEDGSQGYSTCEMYQNISIDNSTTGCKHGYWYDPASGYDETIVSQWDLVCGTGYLVEISMVVSHVGALIGSVVFTRMGDVYGRKPVLLGCMWSNIIVSVVQSFSPNFAFYCVMALIDGMQQQGLLTAGCVLAVEMFPAAQRTFPLNAIEFFWVFGYLSTVLLAYYIRDWRWLQLAITLPMVLTVAFYWVIAESIPWLVANGKTKEAEKIMRDALKFNGKQVPDEPIFTQSETLMEINDNKPEKEEDLTVRSRKGKLQDCLRCKKDSPEEEVVKVKHYGVMDIFKSKTLCRYSLAGFFVFFTNGLAYYAMSLTVTYLPGDRYMNTFLYAILELPAYALAWFLMHKVGRRLPLSIFHFVAGVALICTIIQNFGFYTDKLLPLMITLSMIGKFCITVTFATVYVLVPEMYPTNVRNTGLGMNQVFSKLAMLIAPFSRTLYRTHPWVPPIIFGIMSVMSGFVALILPETRTKKLPDSIEEVEEWSKSKTSKI